MSHSEYTENYKLARFIDTDQPTFLGDWNETMDDIDGAIKGVADKETTLGNTVSALILRVDDHDGRIGTLEDATEELESTVAGHTKSIAALTTKTDELQTDFDSIASATTTTAGLVKISDSTSGTATDTALSQKGAADLVADIGSRPTVATQLVDMVPKDIKSNLTHGTGLFIIKLNPVLRMVEIVGRLDGDDGTTYIESNGAVSVRQCYLDYVIPEDYRPAHRTRVMIDVFVDAETQNVFMLGCDVGTDGKIAINLESLAACMVYRAEGYALCAL